MGASGGAMLPLSSTQRCLKKNSKSSLVKKHTLHWLRLTWSRRHFHSAITAGESGTEHLAKWNAQWNRKFPEFPNFREKRQPREVDQNFRNEFWENLRSIWFCTGISGIFGWMESAPTFYFLINDMPFRFLFLNSLFLRFSFARFVPSERRSDLNCHLTFHTSFQEWMGVRLPVEAYNFPAFVIVLSTQPWKRGVTKTSNAVTRNE